MAALYPMFTKRIAPFFIGKDARDIEHIDSEQSPYTRATTRRRAWRSGCRLRPLSSRFWICSARWRNAPIGLLISDKIYNKNIAVYQANGERDITAEADD